MPWEGIWRFGGFKVSFESTYISDYGTEVSEVSRRWSVKFTYTCRQGKQDAQGNVKRRSFSQK